MTVGWRTEAGERRKAQALRRRLLAGAGALAGHGLVLALVLSARGPAPLAPEPPFTPVALVELPPPPPPVVIRPDEPAPAASPSKPAGPKTPAPPKPAAAKPPPIPQRIVRKIAPSEVPPRLAPPPPPEPPTEVAVSAAELAMATTAESEAAGDGGLGGEHGDGAGGGDGSGAGGRCDMVRRLQRALRNDASVQSAVARARRAPGFAGRPLMVWNGDWIRHGEEEGKGLASVRQAIAVEVAFAPRPCRTQPMRGLVLLSLNDAPGSPRLVLGAGRWRWSDLTLAR